MRNRIFSAIILMLTVLLSQATLGYGLPHSLMEDGSKCEKIYVTADQVLVDAQGIFVMIDDDIVEVSSILHDGTGLFAVPSPSASMYCEHPVGCMKCGRCTWPKCPRRCICIKLY